MWMTNKTELLTGMATLANLSVVAWFFVVKPEQPQRSPVTPESNETKILPEILQKLKEDLFFRGLRDENRQALQIDPLAASPRLVMRFSFQNCDLCINSAFDEVHRMEEELGVDNVLLAGTFRSPREFDIFRQSDKPYRFECHNMPEIYFGLHAEQDASLPFFFVLFPDGAMRHVFFPMKEDVERTRKYLRTIRERYFENSVQ